MGEKPCLRFRLLWLGAAGGRGSRVGLVAAGLGRPAAVALLAVGEAEVAATGRFHECYISQKSTGFGH